MIEFRNVKKIYDKSTVAVDNVSFKIEKGKIIGFLGPNGAGKTTIIRMLLDIIKPDQGEILIEGEHLRPSDKDSIGYLPEERGLYKNEKVLDVLVYISMLNGMNEQAAKESAILYLQEVGLEKYSHYKLHSLSKGMQQKVQFLSAILFNPRIIILDEPFSGLDPISSNLIKSLILKQKDNEKTIILSTHQMEKAEALCDEVFFINNGEILVSGNVNRLKERFSSNELILETNADLSSLPMVESITASPTSSGRCFIVLRDGYSPSDLLNHILKLQKEVYHFEKHLINLESIFIKLISHHEKI